MVDRLPLGSGISIAVSAEHRFQTDAVLLAYFARPQEGESVCDLGSGCGILPLLWWRDGITASVVGVECQEDAVHLARNNIVLAGAENTITCIHADLREWAAMQERVFDCVTCNPPYFPANSGRTNASASRRIARHEGEGCTFSDVCTATVHLLKSTGRFCFCHRPSEYKRLQATLSASGMTIHRVASVRQRVDTEPFLLLCEAVWAPAASALQYDEWILEEHGAPSPLYRHIYAPFYKEVTE